MVFSLVQPAKLESAPHPADTSYAPVHMDRMSAAFKSFHQAQPFDHCIVDNFLADDLATKLEQEFLPYDSPQWFYYNNPIENKKALNDWNIFPKETYKFFSYMNSPAFVKALSGLVGVKLYSDAGLHGGGWHAHEAGGNLNPHLDYSIHPKMGLQRKLNVIIYIASDLKEEHGGHLGFWAQEKDKKLPSKLVKETGPLFNRAIIFDTTQNSWHGMSRPLTQPSGVYRKSLAIYYLCDPEEDADKRGRALFAARENQRDDPEIERIIELRSGVSTSKDVYRV